LNYISTNFKALTPVNCDGEEIIKSFLPFVKGIKKTKKRGPGGRMILLLRLNIKHLLLTAGLKRPIYQRSKNPRKP